MEPLSGARCVKFDVKTRVIPELIQANQRYTRRASDIIRQMHTTLKLESKEEIKDISNYIFLVQRRVENKLSYHVLPLMCNITGTPAIEHFWGE